MDAQWKRHTIRYLTGQTISLFGSALVQYAINWHITLTTQSGVMMTIATLCGFLPQVLISLFAGVWADRYNRKLLIVLADGMIATCTAILAILFTLGYQQFWLLFVISAIRSLGAGIQTPAVGAFLPEIVPQDQLVRVNGINASISSITFLLAPAAAGALLDFMGLGLIFWIDVATAAAGIALLLTLRTPPRAAPAEASEHLLREMFSGLRYVSKTKWLRQFLGFYLFYSLMFGPVVFLTPLMVARSFGPEAWRLVVHEMVFSAGSIVGGLAVGILGTRLKNQAHMLMGAAILFGLTTLLMGFSQTFWFYLGVMLPMGITMPFINTASITILQTKTRPDMLGRVMGLSSIVGSSALPLSMAFFGPLADVMKVEYQLMITGAIMVLMSLMMPLFKDVMRVGGQADTTPAE